MSELARLLDHTLLAPATTAAEVERLCDEALEHGFAAVCVNGVHVSRCAKRLSGSGVALAATVGFPLGASAPAAKAGEAERAIADGAGELDVVVQIGALRERDLALVRRDLAGVVEAARAGSSGRALVKAILETALLDEEEKRIGCDIARAVGADFVKTSTGFGPGGATEEDVRLLAGAVGAALGVKAAGGIRTAAEARRMVAAGASRIGSSRSVEIVRGV